MKLSLQPFAPCTNTVDASGSVRHASSLLQSNHPPSFLTKQGCSLAIPEQEPLHNRLQIRYFDHRKKAKKKSKKAKDNPFKVLKIPEGATLYKDAKRKFLRIAMENHPDTIDDDVSDEDRTKMRDIFIRARIAFEGLAEDPSDGLAILKDDLEDAMENFDSWFQSETGLTTPFQFDLDPETMKEVASMTEKIGGGLDRDGGMWALARMVTASVKAGSDAATPLRLEAGDVKDQNRTINSSLRRRRRR